MRIVFGKHGIRALHLVLVIVGNTDRAGQAQGELRADLEEFSGDCDSAGRVRGQVPAGDAVALHAKPGDLFDRGRPDLGDPPRRAHYVRRLVPLASLRNRR